MIYETIKAIDMPIGACYESEGKNHKVTEKRGGWVVLNNGDRLIHRSSKVFKDKSGCYKMKGIEYFKYIEKNRWKFVYNNGEVYEEYGTTAAEAYKKIAERINI